MLRVMTNSVFISFLFAFQMSDTQDGTSQCPVKSGGNDEDHLPSDWEREECEKIFRRDTSSLRPCFNTVDTEPYMEMCLRDIRRVRNRPEKMNQGICLTAAAYVEECRGAAGIKLWVPRQCASCTGVSRYLQSPSFSYMCSKLRTYVINEYFWTRFLA